MVFAPFVLLDSHKKKSRERLSRDFKIKYKIEI